MKAFIACALVVVGATHAFAQDTNTAPLPLFINGGGIVSPLTNGQPLAVGQTYNMIAIPEAGFVFSSWQPVNVFIFTETTTNPDGSTNAPIISVVRSPVPTYTNQASLNFTMQPVVVIYDTPGVRTITKSSGWQANFVPIVLNIQLGDSAVILNWTNSSYTLQAAPAPSGVYTNILGVVSPYTNNISRLAKYFRLVSN